MAEKTKSAQTTVRRIRRKTHKKYNAEDKILIVINTAMQVERQKYLRGSPYIRDTAMGTNLRRLEPGLRQSLLIFLRTEKAASTHKHWRRDCAVNRC
jgi:hypothetical protein